MPSDKRPVGIIAGQRWLSDTFGPAAPKTLEDQLRTALKALALPVAMIDRSRIPYRALS